MDFWNSYTPSDGETGVLSAFLDAIVAFLNSGFFASIAAAAFGDLFGALAAHRIAKRQKNHDELRERLQETNKAIAMSAGMCNSGLAFKKQNLLKILEEYRSARKTVEEGQKAQIPGFLTVIEFRANMGMLPMPTFPVEKLLEVVVDLPAVKARPLSAAVQLLESFRLLETAIETRHRLVTALRSQQGLTNKQIAQFYFGLPDEHGNVNQEFPDTLGAIELYTDNVIYFSYRLCEDLTDRAKGLLDELKKMDKGSEVKLNKLDWSQPIEEGLIPPESDFVDWSKGFREE